ncbi:zinc metalloproteinase nas-4-like isoform X2 [Portunus trituberculatus]|uniref:zinc metalloproteinase nas-4-like isoform X2 n=1 Tax=Portunus trituberculatus TaxID=210409 RepID=UPI001E1CC8BF|nr:zinc metalloproteinase nas-4-like isoform X2 [Portunus trituberculatus]
MKGVLGNACLLAVVCLAAAAPSDPRFPKTFKEWTPESLINPDELGEYLEGDILLPLTRNGIIGEVFRWPGGEVAYIFDDYTEENKKKVRKGMDRIEYLTEHCITFHERMDEYYIKITNNNSDSCSSAVGMQYPGQPLNYNDACLNETGVVMHELLHALGFYHEQSRYDRDDYVTIMWENIDKDMANNFKKYSRKNITTFGEPYDYGSLMHYCSYAFTKNGQMTIVPKWMLIKIRCIASGGANCFISRIPTPR